MTPTSTLLALAIAALWLPSLPLPRRAALPVWLPLFALALASGLADGSVSATGASALLLLGALGLAARRAPRPIGRMLVTALAAVLALALALHLVPGFRNPVIAAGLALAPDSPPITLYANIDKGAAGLLLVAAFASPLRRLRDWPSCLAVALPLAAATAVAVLGLGWLLGIVRVDPKWPAITPAFLVVNLLFTCVAEEAFFRGLLQARLSAAMQRLRHGAMLAVIASALLFGLAHAAGGPRPIAFATLAGLGYAYAFQRSGRIEAAVLVHFAVNAVHFVGFSYPALR